MIHKRPSGSSRVRQAGPNPLQETDVTEKQIQARLAQLTGSRDKLKGELNAKQQEIAALKQQAAAMKGAAKGAKPGAPAPGGGQA